MVDRRQLRCPACATVCPSGALEVVGQEWDLSEVLRQIDKFAPFYRNSGGGVTLSGGEATMHLDFAAALAASLRARKLHTLLETCGLFPWAPFAEKLAPSLDAVYYDLKIMDPAAHCQYCGADNAAILENFARLVELKRSGGPTTLARVPLVPGVTTGEANLTAIAAFLRGLGVREVALLPYNPLWTDKATKLGVTVDTTLPTTWMAKTEVERCRGYFEGFTVR
jgi:pyruvate formate lyase activating enzyme